MQEKGVTLFGPPLADVIAPISQVEYRAAVREAMKLWQIHISEEKPGRPAQAYAILTMCRALYTWRQGEQVSKKQAATWMAQQFPAWADLVHNALEWRADHRNKDINHEATFPETLEFVEFVTGLILNDKTEQD